MVERHEEVISSSTVPKQAFDGMVKRLAEANCKIEELQTEVLHRTIEVEKFRAIQENTLQKIRAALVILEPMQDILIPSVTRIRETVNILRRAL